MHTSRRPLSTTERIEWLRLTRAENVGPVTFHRLLERFGTAGAALAALPDLARRGGRAHPLRIPSRAEAEREIAAVEKMRGRLLASCEPDYPRALASLDDAPPMLSLLGHPSLLKRPAVAVVGARNASIAGRTMAKTLARDLAGAGFLVVSGMARGIDTAAHEGAIGDGTAAVVAGGADIVYPPENAGLHADLVSRGLIVAESPLGIEPQARHFPRRNRLISGLSLGVVVVEAALKSGSLITARLANDQGREVMAVPGSPIDPRAQGCNRLIKDGATLVESADDVVEVLRRAGAAAPLAEPDPRLFAARSPTDGEGGIGTTDLEAARRLILESLSPTPVLIDEVVRGCQLSAGVVRIVLLELELAGRVQIQPGGRVGLI